MRKFVAGVSLLGLIFFCALFVLSWIDRTFVESIGRAVIRIEVEQKVAARVGSLENSNLVALAERMSGRNSTEIAQLKRQIAQGLPQKIDAIIDQMRNPDCTCRRFLKTLVDDHFGGRIAELASLNDRLTVFVQGKYMEVADALVREFRIFTGANALLFSLLGVTVLVRKRATVQLVFPAIVLLGAALIVTYCYLFEQDWLHTILFSDYVGLGYFAWLGVAVLFLADIVFNRGRVTTVLANVLAGALGGVAAVAPC